MAGESVAKAPPDGYTLMLTASIHVTTPFLFKNIPYDVVKDFTPIALIGNYGLLTVINPAVPARTITEFIAYAKKNPGKLNYASSGLGSGIHFAGERQRHQRAAMKSSGERNDC